MGESGRLVLFTIFVASAKSLRVGRVGLGLGTVGLYMITRGASGYDRGVETLRGLSRLLG